MDKQRQRRWIKSENDGRVEGESEEKNERDEETEKQEKR